MLKKKKEGGGGRERDACNKTQNSSMGGGKR